MAVEVGDEAVHDLLASEVDAEAVAAQTIPQRVSSGRHLTAQRFAASHLCLAVRPR